MPDRLTRVSDDEQARCRRPPRRPGRRRRRRDPPAPGSLPGRSTSSDVDRCRGGRGRVCRRSQPRTRAWCRPATRPVSPACQSPSVTWRQSPLSRRRARARACASCAAGRRRRRGSRAGRRPRARAAPGACVVVLARCGRDVDRRGERDLAAVRAPHRGAGAERQVRELLGLAAADRQPPQLRRAVLRAQEREPAAVRRPRAARSRRCRASAAARRRRRPAAATGCGTAAVGLGVDRAQHVDDPSAVGRQRGLLGHGDLGQVVDGASRRVTTGSFVITDGRGSLASSAGWSRCGAKWQAAWWRWSVVGSSVRQISRSGWTSGPTGQRGWKRHPDGGWCGSAGSASATHARAGSARPAVA